MDDLVKAGDWAEIAKLHSDAFEGEKYDKVYNDMIAPAIKLAANIKANSFRGLKA